MAKVGVVLYGSGVYDGSEIHEATLTLLYLDLAGAETVCMAPDVAQVEVVDHRDGGASGDTRNVLAESSRIARGAIKDLKEIRSRDIDALIFPGGFGAAKNLCSFAVKGPECGVNPDVVRLIKEMHDEKKPLGFMCIAPVIAAKVLGGFKPRLTIGTDKATAEAVEKMGGRHVDCAVDGVVVDRENRIVTTPAYMLGPTISKVGQGIEKLVQEVLSLSR
jgi:enhancing lycopene biosynthesis protein 2